MSMFEYKSTDPSSIVSKITIRGCRVSLFPSSPLLRLALIAFLRVNDDLCESIFRTHPQFAIPTEDKLPNMDSPSESVNFYLTEPLEDGGFNELIDRLFFSASTDARPLLDQEFERLVAQYRALITSSSLHNYDKLEYHNHIDRAYQHYCDTGLLSKEDTNNVLRLYDDYNVELLHPMNTVDRHVELFSLFRNSARSAIYTQDRPALLSSDYIRNLTTNIDDILRLLNSIKAYSLVCEKKHLVQIISDLLEDSVRLNLFSALIEAKHRHYVPNLHQTLITLRDDLERDIKLTQKPWYVNLINWGSLPLAAVGAYFHPGYRLSILKMFIPWFAFKNMQKNTAILTQESYYFLKEGLPLDGPEALDSFNAGVQAATSTTAGFYSIFNSNDWLNRDAYYAGKAAQTLGDNDLINAVRRAL